MDTFEGDQGDPQSCHKYLYVHADPVNRVDPRGKWATFVHKMSIRDWLRGLPDMDIETLCKMQDEVDADANQSAAKAFMHAMSDGEKQQSPEAAKETANNRVRTLLTSARMFESKSEHKAAMEELGRAMHTLQDSTSPAHHGFQPWYDYGGGKGNPHEWMHGSRESVYPSGASWLGTATLRSYNYFTGTTMPADFFADLKADGVVDGIKEKIKRVIPSFNNISVGGAIGGIYGFGF